MLDTGISDQATLQLGLPHPSLSTPAGPEERYLAGKHRLVPGETHAS